MPSPEDRRLDQRVVVGPEHTVCFQVKGHVYRGVRITNLSAGGCFALVGRGDAGVFAVDVLLDQFFFEHPSLPQTPFLAKVVYVLGGSARHAVMDLTGLGIHYVDASPETRQAIANFITKALQEL